MHELFVAAMEATVSGLTGARQRTPDAFAVAAPALKTIAFEYGAVGKDPTFDVKTGVFRVVESPRNVGLLSDWDVVGMIGDVFDAAMTERYGGRPPESVARRTAHVRAVRRSTQGVARRGPGRSRARFGSPRRSPASPVRPPGRRVSSRRGPQSPARRGQVGPGSARGRKPTTCRRAGAGFVHRLGERARRGVVTGGLYGGRRASLHGRASLQSISSGPRRDPVRDSRCRRVREGRSSPERLLWRLQGRPRRSPGAAPGRFSSSARTPAPTTRCPRPRRPAPRWPAAREAGPTATFSRPPAGRAAWRPG